MSEKKINYAYKDFKYFKTTYSCTNQEVEEAFFAECMKMSQTPRPICPAMGVKALCEECEHFGRRAEYISQVTGESRRLTNSIRDIAE